MFEIMISGDGLRLVTVTKYHDIFYDCVFSDGAIYTRWGRRSCPDDAELIYEGEQ